MQYIAFQLNIGTLKVGSIENSASLNIGRNFLREFNSMSKTNQGLGTISGDNNEFPSNTNRLEDPDTLDMLFGSDNEA